MAYPTDLNLLNAAREKTEGIIDTLHEALIGKEAKPRTYREKARKQFLVVSKQRKPGSKVIRKATRRQLGYVGRPLSIIAEQVKVQPIVRGKVKARVEFGAKIAMSMINGYAFLDRLSWNHFNESTTLMEVVEKYRERIGVYPAVKEKQTIKPDTGERNAIEGKFGEGKRKYGLGCIRTRLTRKRVNRSSRYNCWR